MSRADLVRASGLSRTTVSSLVAELIRAGQVTETDDRGRPHKGGSGPPAGAGPAQRTCRRRGRGRRRPRARPGRRGRPARRRAAPRTRPGRRRRARRRGARPDRRDGPCAGRGGHLELSDLAGRRDVRAGARWTGGPPGSGPGSCRAGRGCCPAEELERRLGVPVHADNDANLGALAELHHGIARGRHDVIYLKIASGVGAGIVLGGRLHRGASGIAGEIGHVQVGEDGHVCRCGNRGCLETMVSAARLLEPAAAGVRRAADHRAGAGARRGGRRRRTPGAHRRRPHRRPGRGRPRQQPQPRARRGRRHPWAVPFPGRRLRGSIDRYAQPDTAAALEVVPARSATAPRWSVPSPWRSLASPPPDRRVGATARQ